MRGVRLTNFENQRCTRTWSVTFGIKDHREKQAKKCNIFLLRPACDSESRTRVQQDYTPT